MEDLLLLVQTNAVAISTAILIIAYIFITVIIMANSKDISIKTTYY